MAGIANAGAVLAQRSSVKRIVSLDSLRGLAAFTVVLGHFHGTFSQTTPWYLVPFTAGHAAVVLFFVLSGHVLAIPVWRNKQGPYSKYIVRRFFRIYVPYLAAGLLAVAGAARFSGAALPLTPWFYETWHTPVTWRLVESQFLTMSTSAAFNTAFWSLRYEVEMSILFPLICWLIVQLRAWGTIAFACLCASTGFGIVHFSPVAGLRQEIGITLLWGSCFVFGALTSWKSREIGISFATIPRPWKLVLAACACGAYLSRPNIVIIPAAILIILFAEHSRLRVWLSASIPEYLGRISYSLYLTHGTVLFTLVILLYSRLPWWGIFVIYLPLALSVAHVFCILVEEPAMRYGRQLTMPEQQIN